MYYEELFFALSSRTLWCFFVGAVEMLFAMLLLFELLLLLLLFRSAPFDMLYPPPLELTVTALKLMFLASYPALNRYYCYCCADTDCF